MNINTRNNGWISVKDRLPEDDEYVLTYCECSTKSVRTNWYSTHRKIWHEEDNNITHWQPLPLPPTDYDPHRELVIDKNNKVTGIK